MEEQKPSSPPEDINANKKVAPHQTVKQQLKGILIAIFLGIGIVVIFAGAGGSSSTPSAPVAEVPSTPEDKDFVKHYTFAQDFIKSKASHPSTVDFCSVIGVVKSVEKQTDGSYLYGYKNCMTAKNSYGAELSYEWIAVVHETNTGKLEMINWEINEK